MDLDDSPGNIVHQQGSGCSSVVASRDRPDKQYKYLNRKNRQTDFSFAIIVAIYI